MKMKYIIPVIVFALLSTAFTTTDRKKKREKEPEIISTNIHGKGYKLELIFTEGDSHNHPTMALWIEDIENNFIQPLFVTASFGQGVYQYGKQENNQWIRGTRQYRAALPYFVHKWAQTNLNGALSLPSQRNPVNDAYSGATPKGDFILNTKTNDKNISKFRLVLEINQTWDYNDFWHNALFPDDDDYKTSCQPSLVYAVDIDMNDLMGSYVMNPIGHGHYSGKDGRLYTDISTLTTAKDIFSKIEIKVTSENQ